MKTFPLKSILVGVLFSALSTGAFAAEEKCKTAYDATYKATMAKPDEVLAIVDKDATASPDCVCPIISAAIAASSADKELKIQIVKTAVNAVPEQAPAIKACLPEAASVIDSMLNATSEGDSKSPVSGKEPVSNDKAPVVDSKAPVIDPKGPAVVEQPKDDSDDLWLHAPGMVGGVYLSSPSFAGGGIREEKVIIIEKIKKVKVPGPRVTVPATEFKL